MKFIVFILLIVSQYSYAQRLRRSLSESIEEAVRKGDSLESLFKDNNQLLIKSDTVFTAGPDTENFREILRRVKLTTYYYDSLNNLKKVLIQDWEINTISHFYFEGNYIRKIGVYKNGALIHEQYYFRALENQQLPEIIKQIIVEQPELKKYYDLLLKGKELYNKFKMFS